ncbi:MAG: hypothetical protein ACRCZ9_12015 [Fusobacteriaceae bacterium]
MDINQLMNKCKRRMGLGKLLTITIPDEELKNIIIEETRVTFSRFFPYILSFSDITLTEKNRISRSMYRLPQDIVRQIREDEMEIIGINEMYATPGSFVSGATGTSRHGGFTGIMGVPHMGGAGNNAIFGGFDPTPAANMHQFMAMNRVALYPKFQEPDRIIMKNPSMAFQLDKTPLSFDMKVTHSRSLSTIPAGFAHVFEELALLDLMIAVYAQEFQFFENLDTGFGKIDVPLIEKYKAADEVRRELIRRFEEEFLFNSHHVLQH